MIKIGKQCCNNKDTLCWHCKKFSGLCSWSDRFEPVNGWKAEKTSVKTERNTLIDSYIVRECPEFVEG